MTFFAKLRTISIAAGLLGSVILFGMLLQPPVSVGQEQPSDLPANWQMLNASDFADLAEKYLLSATPQAASQAQLVQHAWKTFLATDDVATQLDDLTLDRLLGIANARDPESLKILTAGLDDNQRAQLLQRWTSLQTRSLNATISKLGDATSLADLFSQVNQIRSSDNPFVLFSPEVGKQIGGWVGRHPDELSSASTNELLEVLDLIKSRGAGSMAVVYQTWISPPTSGPYQFSQIRHGALEGAMSMTVSGQAIYDSSKAGGDRFESIPIPLTAGRRVQLEAVYTFDPQALSQTGKLPTEAGSGRWPIVPVVGVLWRQGDSDFELIPDAAITTDASGKTPGVQVAHYSEPARTTLLFEATGKSLGEINASRLTSPEQFTSQQLLTEILLKRDIMEMLEPPLKPVPEPANESGTSEPKRLRFVYHPTVMTLVESLSPQQREALVLKWLDQPTLLAKIQPHQLTQLWRQIYLLPGSLPTDLLVAWSDARTDWEETLSVEERWELISPKGGSFEAACNASAKQIAATLQGAYADRADDVLSAMVDDSAAPRLFLVKVALAAARNNARLQSVMEMIDQQIEEANDDGDRKALWLIADAYRIEAVEATAPQPEAISRLEEVGLHTESTKIKQLALLEALARSNVSQEVASDVIRTGNLATLRTSSNVTPSQATESTNQKAANAYSQTLRRRQLKASAKATPSHID